MGFAPAKAKAAVEGSLAYTNGGGNGKRAHTEEISAMPSGSSSDQGGGPRALAGPRARRRDDDTEYRVRRDGATPREDYHRERRDWSGDARSEDLASRPRYERDCQRCFAHEEDDREQHTPRPRHESGHAESHGREPTQGRRRDGDWEHLPGDLKSRRGEGLCPEPAWRRIEDPPALGNAYAEHHRRYEQPLHAASGHQGPWLSNPDHRLSPHRDPPHAGGG